MLEFKITDHPYTPLLDEIETFDSWIDFYFEWCDADKDYNLLYRFDLVKHENSRIYLVLSFVQQRKQRVVQVTVHNIESSDMPGITDYLDDQRAYLYKLWKGLD